MNNSAFLMPPRFHRIAMICLGYNLYGAPVVDKRGVRGPRLATGMHATDHLRFDRDLFLAYARELGTAGCNIVLLHVGEGMAYESHPEIACKGALPKIAVKELLYELRMMGIRAFPYLDFSAAHDAWMGDFGRMVSTDAYYCFCTEVIEEVSEVFDRPELFHLGMGREDGAAQKGCGLTVTREGDLWWYDLLYLATAAMRAGSRPWVWADALSVYGETEFARRMPHDVVLSPTLSDEGGLQQSHTLARLRYDQIPAIPCQDPEEKATDAVSDRIRSVQEKTTKEDLLGFVQRDAYPMMPYAKRAHRHAVSVFSTACGLWTASEAENEGKKPEVHAAPVEL